MSDPDVTFRALSSASRRRARRRLAWAAGTAASATLVLLVVWEALAGALGALVGARPWGYAAAAAAATGAALAIARRWRREGPDAGAVATRLERLFPQARGLVSEARAVPTSVLAGARAAEARAWLSRRGARLDLALAAGEGGARARVRRVATACAALLVVAVAVDPHAAQRVASALAAPGGIWRKGAWDIEPGDARIAYGGTVEGHARFVGPPVAGSVVVEWAESGGAWRAETLGPGPTAEWRWEELSAPRAYRFRLGHHSSGTYRIEIESPLTLVVLEARRPGGSWEPLAGRVVRADEPIEVRGRASGALEAAGAVLEEDGSEAPLAVDGERFRGTIRPAAGAWRIVLRGEDGRTVPAAPFHAARSGGAFVAVLRPAEDPARLAASSVWLEVRAGAPDGVRALAWETANGRRGVLGDPRGARDTIVVAVAPLAAGAGAGDTVRWRAVALTASGVSTATPWRSAIVAGSSELRGREAEARDRALRAVERAAREAEGAAREGRRGEADEADRRLREAADSLAAALERTLADPALDPEARRRLEAYRAMLDGVARTELGRADPRGAPRDPTVAARARAELLREIAGAVSRAEAERARAAAVDSLARLADAQRALAAETRATEAGRTAERIGPRQEALARSARAAAERLFEEAAARLDRKLDRAAREVAGGDPESAAEAQESAASAMSQAADEARAAAGGDESRRAARRAAVDRAAGETLFLAERQRAAAERLGSPAAGAGEHAERLARQRVVFGGFQRMLGALVEGLGGIPAGGATARLLAEALYATRAAEGAVTRSAGRGPAGAAEARLAAEASGSSLALLARALLLPEGLGAFAGMQGSSAESGALARQLDQMAEIQRSIADAVASADDPTGGNPEAAAAERRIGRDLGRIGGALEEEGVDRRAVEALARSVEESARRLERGLPGARSETELRSLARRFADLGRIVERQEGERRAERARPFVPAEPPPLPARVTARRLDPKAALAPWEASLPRPAVEPARRYLERLAAEGVRAPGEAP